MSSSRLSGWFVVLAWATLGCGNTEKSASCYVDTQQICYEAPLPSSTQVSNLQVKCSSVSGAFAQPAACPQTGYLGKCAYSAADGAEVDRFYTGADATYQQSYCQTNNLGTWSTTF